MNATATLFPHLEADAGFTLQHAAGDRLREIYTAGIDERHRSAGFEPYHGRKIVCATNHCDIKIKCYTVGLDHAFGMARFLIVHRAMARMKNENRRHHIENALRIRDALCWWGLSAHMRK